MGPTLTIVALWLAFGVTHIVFSSQGLRPRLVAALSAQGFLGAYSLVALATFVPLCWVYVANKHTGPFLWYLGTGPAVRWTMYAGMALALALVVGGLVTPSPASLTGKSAEPRGLLRVTRHPLLMGVALFGLLHLLAARVNAAELAFFAGFPLFVLLGTAHQDQRKLAGGDEAFRRFHEQTAFLPFTGSGALQGLREGIAPVVVGIGLATLIRWLHPSLLGGAG